MKLSKKRIIKHTFFVSKLQCIFYSLDVSKPGDLKESFQVAAIEHDVREPLLAQLYT